MSYLFYKLEIQVFSKDILKEFHSIALRHLFSFHILIICYIVIYGNITAYHVDPEPWPCTGNMTLKWEHVLSFFRVSYGKTSPSFVLPAYLATETPAPISQFRELYPGYTVCRQYNRVAHSGVALTFTTKVRHKLIYSLFRDFCIQ